MAKQTTCLKRALNAGRTDEPPRATPPPCAEIHLYSNPVLRRVNVCLDVVRLLHSEIGSIVGTKRNLARSWDAN